MINIEILDKIKKNHKIFPMHYYPASRQRFASIMRDRFKSNIVESDWFDSYPNRKAPVLETITYEDCIFIQIDIKDASTIQIDLVFWEGDSLNGHPIRKDKRFLFEIDHIPSFLEGFFESAIRQLATKLIKQEDEKRLIKRIDARVNELVGKE